MSVAPEPYLYALTKVLSEALLYCRAWGYSKKVSPEHLGDLMDAIHNLPGHITHWESCDVELLRRSFLGAYDRKWAQSSDLALTEVFDAAIKAHGAGAQQGVQPDGPGAGGAPL